jgi:hypothetical protein
MSNSYWDVRGNYSEKKKVLSDMAKEKLESIVLDDQYNQFLSDKANFDKDDEDPHGQGKRLPYIGWFWRSLDFSSGLIPIGNCGDFIGFIANNKWDYPERYLNETEFSKVMDYIDKSIEESQKGGCLADIVKNTNDQLTHLWEYIQTLTIESQSNQ